MARDTDRVLLRRLGQRVASARADRGFTQEALAEAVGVEPVTVSRWETGDRAMSLSALARVSVALEVPLSTLTDVEQDIPTPDYGPEDLELLRRFGGMSTNRRKVFLALARELSA